MVNPALFSRRRRSGGALAPPTAGVGTIRWSGAVALPDGVSTLVTALGGDSAVLHFADTRANVGTSGGVVDTWDDVRGTSGYGLQLTGTGTARPAWDGVNFRITFDGVNDQLLTAASALYALDTAKALIYIGSFPTVASDSIPVSINNGDRTRFLEFEEDFNATTRPAAFGTGSIRISATAAVTTGATRRLFVASKNNATNISVEVPTDTKQTQPGLSSSPAGNNILYVGAGPVGFASAPVVCAVLVLDHEPDATEVTALGTFATTYHGATLI